MIFVTYKYPLVDLLNNLRVPNLFKNLAPLCAPRFQFLPQQADIS